MKHYSKKYSNQNYQIHKAFSLTDLKRRLGVYGLSSLRATITSNGQSINLKFRSTRHFSIFSLEVMAILETTSFSTNRHEQYNDFF